MIPKRLLLPATLAALFLVSSGDALCSANYKVVAGDTCASIESANSISDTLFHSLNPVVKSDCSNLKVGQAVCLKSTETTTFTATPTAAPAFTGCAYAYVIKANDTCSSMEALTGISDAEFHKLNPSINANCTNLAIGQTICLAGKPAVVQPPCFKWYTAVPGDSCNSIQYAYKLTTSQFSQCNPNLNCSSLVGQDVCISCAAQNPVCTSIHQAVVGESCYGLASSLNKTTQAWLTCNPGLYTCPRLIVGEHVCNSCDPVQPLCRRFYQLTSGDTISGIAQKEGTYTALLLANNPNLNTTSLTPGNYICSSNTEEPFCYKKSIAVEGQDCSTFAAANNISLAQLLLYNPFVFANCSNFYVGDRFCVQGVASALGQSSCATTYTVQSGDTCSSITSKVGGYFKGLVVLNGKFLNRLCTDLQVGEVLCIDNGQIPCHQTVSVKAGESCTTIAIAANISINALVALNPFLDQRCTEIYPGDNLCILSPLLADMTDITPPQPIVPMLHAPIQCVKNITLTTATSCFDLLLPNKISSIDLKVLNPGINCTQLLPASSTICVAQMPPGCTKAALSGANQTCLDCANAASVPLNHFTAMNTRLNCMAPLPPATPICISDPFSICSETKTIVSSDTCPSLQAINGLSINDFEGLNRNLTCSNLVVGQTVCVLGRFSLCKQTYVTSAGDTCTSVLRYSSLSTTTQLQQLNPWVNCSSALTPSTIMCIKPRASPGCNLVAKVQSGDTCTSMAAQYNITLFALHQTNPSLDCQNLNAGQQICVESPVITCSRIHYISSNTTCTAIAAASNITMDQLKFYNPTIDCSNIFIGSIICTSIERIEAINFQLMSSLVPHLATLKKNIQNEYNAYLANPSAQILSKVENDLTTALASSKGASLINALNANDSYFAAYESRHSTDRPSRCNRTSYSSATSGASACFCGSASKNPYLHCLALYSTEIKKYLRSINDGTSAAHSHSAKLKTLPVTDTAASTKSSSNA
ncbi:hypothetical protein K450DRAFT_244058 [Umbelopsis ramanniana AG]|uniref:LysM domain-containing protein n=1 Tax=Umbelopsis ramanniana AG TaxID=1314678 RepID=A0AAD5HE35_UMBRA|nr:uncharacterized protein K450DRAFT_244058 [Umbelopsis ramanniana AG]KAI8579136.1 hypothetical protein K450DRAFT_244058 [Umbelopsis ramanniana AG]